MNFANIGGGTNCKISILFLLLILIYLLPDEPTMSRTCVYYSNWSVYARKHFPRDIPVDVTTNLFYSFIGIDDVTGRVKLTDSWADLELPMDSGCGGSVKGSIRLLFELKRKYRKLKVSMSIGGWGTAHLFQNVMSDPVKMAAFVSSSIEFLLEYGFDGIDIDWEYPNSPQESDQMVELLRQLRQGLNQISNKLLLTVAAPASPETANKLKVKQIDQYLDFWNLMCYDYAGSWSSTTGYHLNLFGNNGDNNINTADTIQLYVDAGVQPSKLVMGMPNYGRSFTAESDLIGIPFTQGKGSGDEAGIWSYKELPVGIEKFDTRKVSAYCYDSSTKTLITYDNPQSARIKAMYVLLKGLGGGMWWESCGDDYSKKDRSLIYNFVDQLNGQLEETDNHLDIYGASKYLNE